MIKKNSVFFIIFCLILSLFPKKAFAQSDLYNQPWQGVFECHDNSANVRDYIKGAGVIARWDWLQPQNNDSIDQGALNSLVSEINQTGKKIYLHFQIYSPNGVAADPFPLPDWLNVYDADPSNDQIGVIRDGNGVNPQVWDVRYQQKLSHFLTLLHSSLVQRNILDKIEYLEPSSGGMWATTHLWISDNDLKIWARSAGCNETDWACLGAKFTEGVNKVYDAYLSTFPEKAVMMIEGGCRYSGCSYSGLNTLLNRYGMRVLFKAAGLGSGTDGTCGLRTSLLQGVCSPSSFMTKCGQEPWGDSVICGGPGFDPARGCEYLQTYTNSLSSERLSYVCMYANDINCNGAQSTNLFVANHVGAQIEILSNSISASEVHPGDQITISLNWKNSGSAVLSAPLKSGEKWIASSYKLFVEFVKDSTISSYQELDINPPTTQWGSNNLNYQTQTSNTFSVPQNLGGTDPNSRITYRVYVGLTDPNGDRIRFSLRNTTNNDLINKRYLISDSFVVAGRGVQITPTPTIPAGTCPSGSLGNINCDSSGKIDETDLDILLSNWAPNGPVPAPAAGQHSSDLSTPLDNKVNESDINILLQNWNP